MNLIDKLVQTGQVVELYKFQQGSGNWYDFDSISTTWYLTNGLTSVTYNLREYLPSSVKRSSINETADPFQSQIKLEFHITDDFASQFIGFTPDVPTILDIYRSNAEDTDDTALYWKGRCVGVTVTGAVIEILCEPIYSAMQAVGLRARYERACRHIVYSNECGAIRDNFKHTTTITDIDGTVVTLAKSIPDYALVAGYIEVKETKVLRYIIRHNDNQIELTRPFTEGVVTGMEVYVFEGCDQTVGTCKEKFNNIFNFGGWPWIPSENPFQTNPFN